MKKLLFFIALISSTIAVSQTTRIKFSYDANGNQTQRILCVNCTSARMANDSIAKKEEDIIENDIVDFDISYFPNPVEETLHINWKNTEDIFVTNIIIYSMTGQEINFVSLKNTEEEALLSFSDLPQGMYSLLVVYNNNEKKSIKILKK